MRAVVGEKGWRHASGVSSAALRQRMAAVPWVVLLGNLLFGVTDVWRPPAMREPLLLIKAGVIVVQVVAGLALLRRPVRRRGAILIGLGCVAVGAGGGVAAAVMTQDFVTTPLLCASAALFCGALIPWGRKAQAAAAALTLLAGGSTVLLVAGRAAALEPIVGLVVASALSVYIAAELARRRAAEARARLALHRHQAELAHVLRVSALGEMGGQLAHELTQPLAAIANYAAGCRRRLEAGRVGTADLLDAVERIGREALRAGAIIRRMRDFLRKAEPQRAPVDLNGLVREVAELLDGEARAAGVTVALELEEPLVAVAASAVEIEQVLVNLARNALEAMQEGGGPARLTFETRRRPGGAVEVLVRDSGPGLPRGAAAALFEPFYTTKPHGLGLGLAISRTIIELHGGTLAATSAASGATFRFTLPVAATGGEVAAPAIASGSGGQ